MTSCRQAGDTVSVERGLPFATDEVQAVMVALAKEVTRERDELAPALDAVGRASARLLRVERVNIWLYSSNHTQVRCIHQYDASQRAPEEFPTLAESDFPRYFAALAEVRTVAANDACHDPRTSELSESYLRPHGISALLDAPLRLGDAVLGVVCHEHVGPPRIWTPSEQTMAGSMADMICLAMQTHERTLAQRQLQQLNASLEQRVAERSAAVKRWADQVLWSEAALRDQTQIQQSILDCISDGVVVADVSGRFLQFNPAAHRMLRAGPADVPSDEWSEVYGLYLPDQTTPYPAADLPLARAIRGEEVREVEIFVRPQARGDGVWLSVNARPLTDEQGNVRGGVAVFRDVTRRRASEREVRQLNLELEQRVQARTSELAAANAELETFCYSVSHDLRAPLRSINGFSSLLLKEYAGRLDDRAQQLLGRVGDAAERMGQLIDALLQLSRTTRGTLERTSVDLSELGGRIMEDLRQAEPQRRVECDIQSDLRAEGDPALLYLLLENLLGNAWKFSAGADPARIRFGKATVGGQEALFVSDNGVGFDMAYVDRLFGPFERLHGDSFAGLGVGLANVQRIVGRHGGHVWAEGAVDQGATFYFTLR